MSIKINCDKVLNGFLLGTMKYLTKNATKFSDKKLISNAIKQIEPFFNEITEENDLIVSFFGEKIDEKDGKEIFAVNPHKLKKLDPEKYEEYMKQMTALKDRFIELKSFSVVVEMGFPSDVLMKLTHESLVALDGVIELKEIEVSQ